MMITGILLAAGLSSRFGSQKLIATLPSGLPIAVASWRALKEAHDNSIAVIRHDDAILKIIFEREKIPFLICQDAHLGMARSLLTGIQNTLDSDGWIIALGDMPLIDPETIKRIAKATSDQEIRKLVFRPTFHKKPGNPIGLRSTLRDELMALRGDQGAREIIKNHINDTHFIPVEDEGIIKDIDTQQDLETISAQRN
jgi:molybdenum cofactor cytidylyltransferase